MDVQSFFEQAKSTLNLPKTTPLQSAYQFGSEADEPLPKVGAYDVILDAHDQPVCVTRTDQVMITPYLDITATHAYLEGEGDRTYAYWRHVHDVFFEQEYQSAHQVFDPQTAQMVLERFHVVYPAH
ncbi:ASCH domain-containing protein [Lactiplantibacillus paraplantarum]|uniref:ASCH domain-containing protein n=1 Tax=Lactiplantibacillus paraplantarum TaxID=60520 RepID=UPI00051297A5|nr:ASCH domain-containing protein [Lactiplantibacillus paraplantarum]OAX74236.1 RNA-binding protein [Lactiplantibacillus plantarum]ALO03427.1 RNA-binding protein [Lactiplantibacillus paraplantarum]KGE75547.1 RNA-binding protein [Lactiplantibacillus paraplantarum]MCW1908936.1 ASCH domain-containing protein [Lactiplantibacillus paraplantarum]RDG11907.1 ASCH domain-containing protein [Lactiplantibacillus paraplantarum]